jgi:hypothetical protein
MPYYSPYITYYINFQQNQGFGGTGKGSISTQVPVAPVVIGVHVCEAPGSMSAHALIDT